MRVFAMWGEPSMSEVLRRASSGTHLPFTLAAPNDRFSRKRTARSTGRAAPDAKVGPGVDCSFILRVGNTGMPEADYNSIEANLLRYPDLDRANR